VIKGFVKGPEDTNQIAIPAPSYYKPQSSKLDSQMKLKLEIEKCKDKIATYANDRKITETENLIRD
jgi:hypothetical protein